MVTAQTGLARCLQKTQDDQMAYATDPVERDLTILDAVRVGERKVVVNRKLLASAREGNSSKAHDRFIQQETSSSNKRHIQQETSALVSAVGQ